MPAWGRRQSYPAVVGTTTVLVGVFAVATWLRPYIPEPEPNPIVVHRGQFMANASRQRIRWRSLEDAPFAEARRTDRLVVLLVGCAWNWQARSYDRSVLMETEVAERLNREFVPVRVDASIKPEWESGPIPLGSAESGSDPGWYLVILRPDGQVLDLLTKEDPRQRMDSQVLQSMLTRAQAQKKMSVADTDSKFSRRATTEAAILVGQPDSAGGNLALYAKGITANTESDRVFVEGDAFRWHPWEWRFLLAAGLSRNAEDGLRSVLSTSLVDWIDGGMFRTDSQAGPNGVRFEKLAVENADMACVLSLLAVSTSDSGLKMVARRQFDAVMSLFVTSDQVFAYSYTDAEAQGRNPIYSVRPKILRDEFSSTEIGWMQEKLGLRVQSNPSMLVRVRDLTDVVANEGRYDDAFKRLRAVLVGKPPVTAGSDLANVVGGVCARLVEAARILGDRERLARARDLYSRVLEYKSGPDGIRHSLKPTPDMVAFLGDYTAFADASLQEFLSTGNTTALTEGELVLRRAKSLFGQDREGVIGTIPTERALPEAGWVALPNVVDGSQGSLVGDYARLAEAYSLALRDVGLGGKWRESALTTVAQYAALTKELRFRIGDLAHAMVQVSKDQVVVVVGPKCVDQALGLAPKLGDTLVVPAVGSVRKDVQSRGPGIYVCTQDTVTGPLTAEAVVEALHGPP